VTWNPKTYYARYYQEHKKGIADRNKAHRMANLKEYTRRDAAYHKLYKERNKKRKKASDSSVKKEVLAHYGPEGHLRCAWKSGCSVTDVDMLSLDHINDNGAEERRQNGGKGGVWFYRHLRKNNYPLGYQTLCFNHQWKKEIMKKTALSCSPLVPRSPWSRTEYLENFATITKEMLDLTTKKNNDYASSSDPFANFKEFGELGILVRLSDKFARLRNALYDRKDMAVSDETVEDTILDLATYAVLLLCYRRGAK